MQLMYLSGTLAAIYFAASEVCMSFLTYMQLAGPPQTLLLSAYSVLSAWLGDDDLNAKFRMAIAAVEPFVSLNELKQTFWCLGLQGLIC